MAKLEACFNVNITPILCVTGAKELSGFIRFLAGKNLIIAYEPAKAVGTGDSESAVCVRKEIKEIRNLCKNIDAKFLYGGSITQDNFSQYLMKEIDGYMLGKESLNLTNFINIIKGVEKNNE